MKIINTAEITATQKFEIFELWNNESPVKLSYNDISDYLSIKIKNIPLLEVELYQN